MSTDNINPLAFKKTIKPNPKLIDWLAKQISWLNRRPINTRTIHRGVKTGRNEDCPCGSHKKYKKCCGKH